MKHINWRELTHYLFAAVSIVGFLLLLGTVGGMTNDSITWGRGLVQCAIGMVMWIGGLIIYDN